MHSARRSVLQIAQKSLSNEAKKFNDLTRMQLAAQENDFQEIVQLAKSSVDMDAVTQQRKTPLYLAVERGHTLTAQVLLALGAKKELAVELAHENKRSDLETKLEQLVLDMDVMRGLLFWAVNQNDYDILKKLIVNLQSWEIPADFEVDIQVESKDVELKSIERTPEYHLQDDFIQLIELAAVKKQAEMIAILSSVSQTVASERKQDYVELSSSINDNFMAILIDSINQRAISTIKLLVLNAKQKIYQLLLEQNLERNQVAFLIAICWSHEGLIYSLVSEKSHTTDFLSSKENRLLQGAKKQLNNQTDLIVDHAILALHDHRPSDSFHRLLVQRPLPMIERQINESDDLWLRKQLEKFKLVPNFKLFRNTMISAHPLYTDLVVANTFDFLRRKDLHKVARVSSFFYRHVHCAWGRGAVAEKINERRLSLLRNFIRIAERETQTKKWWQHRFERGSSDAAHVSAGMIGCFGGVSLIFLLLLYHAWLVNQLTADRMRSNANCVKYLDDSSFIATAAYNQYKNNHAFFSGCNNLAQSLLSSQGVTAFFLIVMFMCSGGHFAALITFLVILIDCRANERFKNIWLSGCSRRLRDAWQNLSQEYKDDYINYHGDNMRLGALVQIVKDEIEILEKSENELEVKIVEINRLEAKEDEAAEIKEPLLNGLLSLEEGDYHGEPATEYTPPRVCNS